jgi:vanillate O-demethylase ferredoxin subunit
MTNDLSTNLLSARVAKKTVEATDICSFELTRPAGGAWPAFSAGSHIDLHLASGLIRQYSLCNDPQETHRYVIAVLRDPASRGGSQAVHDYVKEGDLLRISEPRNHFVLEPTARKSLLLAGGIGITPLLAMAEQLHASSADFSLHYCARSRQRTAFLERIQAGAYASRAHFHFDDGNASQRLDIDALFDEADSGTHLYVCGPTGFLDLVITTAKQKGWPSERIHFEYFSAVVETSENDGSFDVKIASSGQLVRIAADRTVFECLEEAGVDIPVACEQGVCGTCLTRILEGTPDHRDHYLTDDERAKNDQFLPCCSRSKSRLLVLDL